MKKYCKHFLTALIAMIVLLPSCSSKKPMPIIEWEAKTDITVGQKINPTMQAMIDHADEFVGFETIDAVKTIEGSELGLVADDPMAGEENVSILNTAIESAPDGTALLLDNKTYYLYGTIHIQNKVGLIIKGKGTNLVNTDYDPVLASEGGIGRIFEIRHSSNITIQGLNLDFYRHVNFDGSVEKIEGGYCYVRAIDECVTGKKLPVVGGESIYAVSVVDTDGTPGAEKFINGATKLELVEGSLFRYRDTTVGKKGDRVSLRFHNNGSLMNVIDTETFLMREVNVYSNHGLGVYIGGDSKDFCFEETNFKVAKGSKALYSTNVDCFHFGNGLRGKLLIRNSIFDGLGDDVLNIHSGMAVTGLPKGNQFTAYRAYNKAEKNPVDTAWCKKGDQIAFYAPNLSEVGIATVESFEEGIVTVDRMPEGVTADHFAHNISLTPYTVVKNCTVCNGRARAFLLQTKNALIEGNTIYNMRLAGILISPDFYYWGEAGFSDNILIQNNTIYNTCKDETCSKYGAILIAGCHDFTDFPVAGINPHKNISIIDNSISDIKGAAVYSRATQNLVVEDNIIKNCTDKLIQAK